MYRIDGNERSGKVEFEYKGKECCLYFNAKSIRNYKTLMDVGRNMEALQNQAIKFNEKKATKYEDVEKLADLTLKACLDAQDALLDIFGKEQWEEVFGKGYVLDEVEVLSYFVGEVIKQCSTAQAGKTADKLSENEI